MVLNYPQAGYDGRGPRVPDMAPIDMLRSEVGGFTNLANSSAVILTIPTNKVLHIRTILWSSSDRANAGTVGLRVTNQAGTATIWNAYVFLSVVGSNNCEQYKLFNNITGFLLTASTTQSLVLRAVSNTICSYMWVGGIMRERNSNDTST